MDFSEDFDVSPPCLIVPSSQIDDSQKLGRSDTDPYLLKQLNISRSNQLFSRNTEWTMSRMQASELKNRKKDEATELKQDGTSRSAGGSGNGNPNRSEQRNDNHRDHTRHAQTRPLQGPGGGGGGAGGDGGDGGDNDDSHHEPSTCEEDTTHSEMGTSSSGSLPELIPQSSAATHQQDSILCDSINRSIKLNVSASSGSDKEERRTSSQASTGAVDEAQSEVSSQASGGVYSQASTVIVGDAPNVPLLLKKSPSSSSSGGYRSDLTSSSAYQGSISSNPSSMSDSLHGPTPETHMYPLPLVVRTQSTSDGSTSGDGSREGISQGRCSGFSQLESVEENASKQDLNKSDSSKENIEQECSSQEDMFVYNKEDSSATGISSQEVSRLSTPQDRSTPVDQKLSQEKVAGTSLYRQVLTLQTSTPVESDPNIQDEQTPPSQSFNCLTFSGSVKESSSSSSSGVLKGSPETLIGVPLIIPSSPTSLTSEQPLNKSIQDNSSHSTRSSSSLEENLTVSKMSNVSVKDSSESSAGRFPPSPSSFEYGWRKKSMMPSPEGKILHHSAEGNKGDKGRKQENNQKANSENDDEDIISLPHWQIDSILKNKKAEKRKSSTSSSTTSSSSSSSKESYSKSPYSLQEQGQHSWQSLGESSTIEGSKSAFLNKKQDSRSSEMKHVTFRMDVSESASPEEKKARSESTVESNYDINTSLSPSSIDGQKALAKSVDNTSDKETKVISQPPRTTCTLPEMSEDLFRPSSFNTQEKSQEKDHTLPHETSKGVQSSEPTSSTASFPPEDKDEEEEDPEDVQSQNEPFELHFTQSQSEMDSQPLIPEPPSSPSPTLPCPTDSATVECDQIILPLSSLLRKQDSSTSTPSQSILVPAVFTATQEEYRSLQQQNTSEIGLAADDDSKTGTDANHKSLTEQKDKHDKDEIPSIAKKTDSDTSTTENIITGKDATPPLLSEVSSESGSGMAYHFSLPTSAEPLRPVTCTTPPPVPLKHQTQRTTVCETPGLFTQESNITVTSSRQLTTPSLTFSMPRQESPELESENETDISFQMNRPQATSSSSSTTSSLTTSRKQERSVFARVRDEAHASKRDDQKDDEYNPFDFTSQDDVPFNPQFSRRKSRKRERENEQEIEQSIQVCSRKSETQVKKIRKTDLDREPAFEKGRSSPEDDARTTEELRSSVSAVSEEQEPLTKRFHKFTETRVVRTITTSVKRVITITMKKEGSDEIIEKISYEEDETPKTVKTEDVSVEEEKVIERDDSIYEIVRQPPTPLPVVNVRKSPRAKKRSEDQNREELDNVKSKRQRKNSNSEHGLASKIPSNVEGSKRKSPRNQKKVKTPEKDDDINFPPLLRRESTEKIVEDKGGSSRSPESALSYTPGTRVFAHWSDNHFYPGVLTSGASKLGLYNVTFDDGDKRKVRAERLILKDSLHVGQHVLAQDVDGYYDPGVIVGHYRSGAENGYEIKDSRGIIKRYSIQNVILTEEQAAAILSSSCSLSRTTSGSSLSVGRVNSRTRSTRSTDDLGSTSRSGSSNISSGGLNTRSRDTSAKDTSCSSNDSSRLVTSPKTRPQRISDGDETPKSSRKKSIKKLTKVRNQPQSWRDTKSLESSSETSTDEQDKRTRGKRGARRELGKLLSMPTRTSPRKHGSQQTVKDRPEDSYDEEEPSALVPLPSDDTLFAGFAFLITGCQNVKDTKEDSTDSESEIVEFNRHHLVQQIEAGGGVILKDVQETQISGADQCFLISNSHQRTQKFFQCLAYDIPIVHHSWIHDSSTLNQIRDHKKYLLPTGTSLETGEVVECGNQPRPKVLHGMKIYLHGSPAFKKTWSSVLLAAGCLIVTKLPNRPGRAAQSDDFNTMCDVIISGTNTLPASVRHIVELLDIPVVALEWLFQCLINGFVVPYDGHPKYDYKNIQKDDSVLG